MKQFFIAATLCLAACGPSQRTSHHFAQKKITSVQKVSLVTIEGSPGKFMVPSDTIKVNDVVPVIFKSRY